MPDAPASAAPVESRGVIDRFFHISERGSTVGREVRGGLATFFTMAYIVVLNPLILGLVPDGTGQFLGGGANPDLAKIAAATALVAGVMTIAMGVIANFPFAIAAGLGLNAFVAFSIAGMPGMTWADAMGLVVIEGIVILVLVLTGFRQAVFHAIPAQLKTAMSVGIGLFVTFVGLYDAGIVRKAEGTPVQLGPGGFLAGWPSLVFVVGLLAIVTMLVRQVKGAILYGIVGATGLAILVEALFNIGGQKDAAGKLVNPTGWGLNIPRLPNSPIATPDLGLLGHFNLLGSVERVGALTALLLVFTLVLADFFDTMGTMVAIGAEADLLDEEGTPVNASRILVVDASAAIVGGAAGTSSNTGFIESTSGVAEGARTGLASVVTGVLFLVAMFLTPLVEVVPYEAATPALVVVGFLMMQQVSSIDWRDLEIAIPAFLTMVMMPFTYSITAGIGSGFVAFVAIKVAKGKFREIHALMWVVTVMFLIYFTMDPIRHWLVGA
ncbi:NCS2 family permease [Dermatophilus congolensis]|uniref:NCS2 family permease n=1 Tax=Dermatophilus congolensis TaxID=1863 RepID=UPI001AAEB777|nr:NCS2 family permease [Dermatophilus congolensis]MBO3128689.1 NCS2 family permease [Dermatophilus congolensis]MBO3132674.1 NCS2 family permease [Dermatophilus congolensis]MBO3133165.1 NCS2 family permease [Dermatophilus congolensis]MBO3135400.1 NCS2 family permease [Dermatophilus congolensis]MBO3137641.1 NCS2 family permease [Dermatophilus congolensis]